MTTALQTRMPMPTERITVLLNVHCVRALLEMNEDEADTLARQEWGFDISSGESKRADIRILPAVATNFILTGGKQPLAWDWERVAKELMRGAIKTLPRPASLLRSASTERYLDGTTAWMILNCSSTHGMEFVKRGQLKKLPGTNYSSGPNGTPKITVESFLEFLRKRRVR